jgi:1-acyl-sn-glycerol-3-phosphate acyltransferase
VSKPVSYAVPWRLVFSLTRCLLTRSRYDLEQFTADVAGRMDPPPVVLGAEHLPEDPRFALIANHYQRRGLWILHPAAVLTQAVRARYGPGNPPVRWLATANWPRWKIGPWSFRSPGDVILPRVAHALWCYPVSFFGADPAYTARSLRALLRDVRTATRPIGLFPEGVAGTAGRLAPPLPGVDRLLRQLNLPLVPAGISESDGRLVIRIGPPVGADADFMAAVAGLLAEGTESVA